MKKNNPWKKLSSKIIFSNPWIKLSQDSVTTPSGHLGTYAVLEANPFVVVVAIQKNNVVMIEQFRYPINQAVTEFPAGGINKGETPLAAAKRELLEETGYEAKAWEYVGKFYELVSISRQQGHLFIARDLTLTDNHKMPQEGITKQLLISFMDLEHMIDTGKIIDALTPATFYKVKLRLASQQLKRDN